MNKKRPGPLRALALAVSLMACPAALQAADGSGPWSPFDRALDSVSGLFGGARRADQPAPSATTDDASSTPIDQPHPVSDLAYGDLLFDYYQDNHFAAITKILVAQERGLLGKDAEKAQVLLGALYVSYGMLDKGEAIFQQLLKQQTSAAAADEAWYQLARIHYKRGNTGRTLQLLTQQVKAAPEARPTEYLLLQILCHIRLEQTREARALLPLLKDDKSLSVFVRFNMGSAFSQLGDMEKAEGYFKQVARLQAHSDTDWLLKDRASVALGVQYLKQEQWLQARRVLEQVRLYGPMASRGLLALGWVNYNSADPVSALNPWLELTERDLADPAAQEALLNIPYVYEQQGGLKEALNRYRTAYDEFAHQQQLLEQAKEDIRKADWIKQISPVEQDDTQGVMDSVPPFTLATGDKTAPYLYTYFASNEFQRLYQDYRELQRLYMVLIHWRRQLPSFEQMIQTNVERLDKLGPRSQQALDNSKQFYAWARIKLDEYSAKLDQIIAHDDLSGTANVPQLVQKERLEAAEQTLQSMGDPSLYEEEWTKLRLLKGLLMWDLNATALDRRWEMSKDRIATHNLLVDLEASIRRVQIARDQRIERFQGFASRIQELDQRITRLQGDIAVALQDNRLNLQAVALGILDQRQTQLDRMRAKALLNIARLQDRGYVNDRTRNLPASAQNHAAPNAGGKAAPVAKKRVISKPEPQSLSEAIEQILEE